MSFGLLRFMIIKERLERTGAYLSVIEGICISILSLLQGVHNKRSHDLHVCAESPENWGSMTLGVFLKPICCIVYESIEVLNIKLVFVKLNCFIEMLSVYSWLKAWFLQTIEIVLSKSYWANNCFIWRFKRVLNCKINFRTCYRLQLIDHIIKALFFKLAHFSKCNHGS